MRTELERMTEEFMASGHMSKTEAEEFAKYIIWSRGREKAYIVAMIAIMAVGVFLAAFGRPILEGMK